MRPQQALLIIFVATAPLSAQAHEARPRVPKQVDEQASADEPELAAAKALFNLGQYQEAALAFDALYTKEPRPGLLHFAAIAWASAHDDTRAIMRWQSYFDDPAAFEHAEFNKAHNYLLAARKRTITVAIKIDPAGALLETSELELARLPGGLGQGKSKPEFKPIRFPVTQALTNTNHPATLRMPIAPGHWRISVIGLHHAYTAPNIEIDVALDSDSGTSTDLSKNKNKNKNKNKKQLTLTLVHEQGRVTFNTDSKQLTLPLIPEQGPVEFAMHPTRAKVSNGPILLHLEDSAAIEAPRDLRFTRTEPLLLRLHIGTWRYRAADRVGDLIANGEFEITAESSPRITIDSLSQSAKRRRANTRTTLGLGLGSATLGAAGLGLLLPSSYMLRDAGPRVSSEVRGWTGWFINRETCPSPQNNNTTKEKFTSPEGLLSEGLRHECVVAQSLALQPIGASLLGTSLGLATGAVMQHLDVDTKYYSIPGAVGLASIVAGGVLLSNATLEPITDGLNDMQQTADTEISRWAASFTITDALIKRRRVMSAATGILSLGGGLIIGTGIVLIRDQAHSTRQHKGPTKAIVRVSPTAGGARIDMRF